MNGTAPARELPQPIFPSRFKLARLRRIKEKAAKRGETFSFDTEVPLELISERNGTVHKTWHLSDAETAEVIRLIERHFAEFELNLEAFSILNITTGIDSRGHQIWLALIRLT